MLPMLWRWLFITMRKKKFKFEISKRQSFVLVTIFLTLGLLITQLIKSDFRFLAVGILAVLTYFLFAWALREDLAGIEWLTLLLLPALFTLAVGFSYFLLPVRWITRLPIVASFGVGIYALLLTENIYNVAAIRTIQLLRPAHTVGFLLTLVSAFLLFEVLFSFHFPFWGNFLGVFLITLLLIFQSLWSINLEPSLSSKLLLYTLFLSLSLAELGLVLSFWPLSGTMVSLFLTTVMYGVVGLTQHWLTRRLFRKVLREFVLVAGIVFLLMLITTRWGG